MVRPTIKYLASSSKWVSYMGSWGWSTLALCGPFPDSLAGSWIRSAVSLRQDGSTDIGLTHCTAMLAAEKSFLDFNILLLFYINSENVKMLTPLNFMIFITSLTKMKKKYWLYQKLFCWEVRKINLLRINNAYFKLLLSQILLP